MQPTIEKHINDFIVEMRESTKIDGTTQEELEVIYYFIDRLEEITDLYQGTEQTKDYSKQDQHLQDITDWRDDEMSREGDNI